MTTKYLHQLLADTGVVPAARPTRNGFPAPPDELGFYVIIAAMVTFWIFGLGFLAACLFLSTPAGAGH